MAAENIAGRAQPMLTPQSPSQPWARTTGWALNGAALALVGYVVIAVTLGAGFEQDPVAPIVIVPGALILGIALLRSNRR